MNETKRKVWNWLDEKEEFLSDLSLKIWKNPELPLKEEYASELLISVLEEEGFDIEKNIAGMETAFIAEYGEGKPILGVLGEYDALSGLSQKIKAKKDPIEKGAPGHGCGHNLLGVGSLGAALAVKNAIEDGDISGTIRFYGCPAEEMGAGKIFMAREGVFDDLDACLTWHPMNTNAPRMYSHLAVTSVKFYFEGVSAHAAASPQSGRSALDAVELMNVGSNYLREHIVDEARIHYSIEKGGEEPNVVPDEAIVWYYIRAPKRHQVDSIFERVKKIAKGAAMMTETDVTWKIQSSCYNTLHNKVLSHLLLDNMKEIGGPAFTDEDREFAKKLEGTLEDKESVMKPRGVPDELIELALHEKPVEKPFGEDKIMPGSTDVGDVSWITPLAQMGAAAWPMGTPPHTWQSTASSGSGIGLKAMQFTAKTIAGTLVDIYEDESILKKAREEFEKDTGGKKYKSPLPEDVKSPNDK